MTVSVTTKIRVIGGASALALSAGLSIPALAQAAPEPLEAAPIAPVTPMQPGNVQQCVEDSPDVFVCNAGFDPDGVGEDPLAFDPADPIRISIQAGAFVTGSNAATNGGAVAGDVGTIVTNFGTIVGTDDFAVILNSDSVFNNLGFVRSDTDIGIETNIGVIIRNSGTIVGDSGDTLIRSFGGLRLVNTGLIQEDGADVITVLSDGDADTTAFITNDVAGSIFGTADNTTVFNLIEDALIENDGLIQAFGADSNAIVATGDLELVNTGNMVVENGNAVEMLGGTVENSGTILSRSSVMGEFTAAIYFSPGAGEATVTNQAGGLIEGGIGIFADIANTGDQTVVNFGTITGRDGEAAFLGGGDDEFQQWSGATVNGNVRLAAGDDTFVLEGMMSSISGFVSGGAGNDTAILGGIFDGDNISDFEAISLGQLFDLQIVGARSVTGNVSVDGNVTLGLGADSLTVDGDLTFADGSAITILTPLNSALVGQTVSVFEETGTFTDDGATITVVDDDLLLDYEVLTGSLQVTVNAVNPAINSADPNINTFSGQVGVALANGTLGAGLFDPLNALPDVLAYEGALADALPSLSEAVAREIFETSNAASQALNRHLAGDGSGIWGQFIVRGADQDALSPSADGYESDQIIFTVGGDFQVFEDVRFGVLASYADIDNDDQDANGASTANSDVESFKFGAYVAVDLFDRGFFNTEVAYLTGDVDTSRSTLFGAVSSGFDFDGITVSSTLGYDVLPDENVSLTPTIGVNAAEISFDDATETGGFGFLVERGDAEFIELRGGLELGAQISEKVSGFISGTVIRDLEDSTRSFRLTSTQLSSAFFVDLPEREQDRFELAAGASIDVSENIAVGLGYLGDFNDGYDAHSARANVRVSF